MGVQFELTFQANELKRLDLPVEIRKPNMVLVKRVMASEKVELEPGTYYVGIKMPAGQESWAEVKVNPDSGYQTIRLGPEPSQASASESQELQQYFATPYVTPPIEELTYLALIVAAAAGALIGGSVAYVVKGNSEVATGLSAVVGGGAALLLSKVLRPGYAVYKRRVHETHLRKFHGNLLGGDLKTVHWSPQQGTVKTTDELIEIDLEGENRGQVIQLLQTDEPAVNVVLPAWQERGCRVVLKKQPDARYSLEVHLKNTDAELLLRYWEQGRWQLAANVASSPANSAERLLYDKLKHPISAAVGGYALLRLGALDRLHDWSANLKESFEWLPDGAAVRGEHLARLGEHQKALQAFCALRERGLPYFSDGLNYAVDRLRRYQSLGEKHFDTKDLKDCADTLARLEPFCYFTDFSKPFLTFTGLDPMKPDAKPISGKLADYGGLDVTTLKHSNHRDKEIVAPPRVRAGA